MKKKTFIQGSNPEAKFASIENALQKISRRMIKKVGVDIPPIPVSKYADAPEDDGVLMRYMFPAAGKVDKAIIWIEEFPEEKRIPLKLDIETVDGVATKNLEVTPKLNQLQVGMEVAPGSRFTLSLKDPETKVSKIWLSFLYQITIKHSRLQEITVDEIDKISEETKS